MTAATLLSWIRALAAERAKSMSACDAIASLIPTQWKKSSANAYKVFQCFSVSLTHYTHRTWSPYPTNQPTMLDKNTPRSIRAKQIFSRSIVWLLSFFRLVHWGWTLLQDMGKLCMDFFHKKKHSKWSKKLFDNIFSKTLKVGIWILNPGWTRLNPGWTPFEPTSTRLEPPVLSKWWRLPGNTARCLVDFILKFRNHSTSTCWFLILYLILSISYLFLIFI